MSNTDTIEKLKRDYRSPDPKVKVSAVYGLGNLGDEAVIPILIEALEDDNFEVCRAAFDAASHYNHPSLIPALGKGLRKINDGVPVGALASYKEEALSVLLEALLDRSILDLTREGVEDAVVSIGKPAIPGLLQALMEALNAEETPWYKLARTVGTLGLIADPLTIPYIKQALFEKAVEGSGWALARIGTSEAIEILLDALNDQNAYVRVEAIDALGQAHIKVGIDKIIGLLSDNTIFGYRRRVCEVAAEALENFQTTASFEAIRTWRSLPENQTFRIPKAIGNPFTKSRIFKEAELSQIDFENTDFRGGVFQKSDFQEANFVSTRLEGVHIEESNLTRAKLNNVKLVGAYIRHCEFVFSNLQHGCLAGANISNTDFSDADLRNADFRGSRLLSVNFRNADLSQADFSGANIRKVDFRGTNLIDVDFGGASLNYTSDQNTIWPDGFETNRHPKLRSS